MPTGQSNPTYWPVGVESEESIIVLFIEAMVTPLSYLVGRIHWLHMHVSPCVHTPMRSYPCAGAQVPVSMYIYASMPPCPLARMLPTLR